MKIYSYSGWDSLMNHLRGLDVVKEPKTEIFPMLGALLIASALIANWRRFMPGGMEAYLQREMEKVAWKKDTPISDGYGGYLIKYEGEWRRSLSHFYVDVDGIVRDGRHRPQKLDPTNSTGWFVDYDLMFKEQKVYKRYSMPTMLMARIALFKRKITRGLGF